MKCPEKILAEHLSLVFFGIGLDDDFDFHIVNFPFLSSKAYKQLIQDDDNGQYN